MYSVLRNTCLQGRFSAGAYHPFRTAQKHLADTGCRNQVLKEKCHFLPINTTRQVLGSVAFATKHVIYTETLQIAVLQAIQLLLKNDGAFMAIPVQQNDLTQGLF